MKFFGLATALLLCTVNFQGQVSNPPPRPASQTRPKTATPKKADAASANSQENSGPKATDAERDAVVFTAYDLDIRVTPQDESLAVRAVVKVKNAGTQPLAHVPLQISSTLLWQSIRVGGAEATLGRQNLPSDADHTGMLHEAVVVLSQPLAPGKEIAMDVVYSGRISLSGQRLEAIGTPSDLAKRSDWDRISADFVGLRGFGNVAWYPIASVPVMLGDGARLFVEIGHQKQRQSAARISMKVTQDFFGVVPNVAILDGHGVALTGPPAGEAPSPNVPQVVTCTLPATTLGFSTPSLFIASRYQHDAAGLTLYTRAENEGNVQAYLTAATMVQPLMRDWLGSSPKTPLLILDLPEGNDAPYETGAALFLPIAEAKPEQLTNPLSHALAHSYFRSPREWLNEGIAHFMGDLWIEKSSGRGAAIRAMDSGRSALAIAEPGSPGGENGQSLIDATDAVYYRTKASYVLWMLRDMVGDGTLSAALRAYNPADDVTPEYFERMIEQTSHTKDLLWFFNDWVYNDKGLPDLSIAGVFPSKSSVAGSYLVAVEVANDGYAACDVPVTVRSQGTKITQRLVVPARSRATHRFVIEGEPVEVIVNDGSVPEVGDSIHSRLITRIGANN
jgi:hypothetical protein